MEDENLTIDDEQEIQEEEKKPARSDNRFKDLSDKVETAAKERDEAKAIAETAQKEVEFYKGFSKVSSKYEGAGDYQDKILEKVNAGYDLEDATISVLAKAGKLTNAPEPRESPAGGSATTAMKSGDEKPLGEMTQAEKRAALIQSDEESPGSLCKILRSTNYGG